VSDHDEEVWRLPPTVKGHDVRLRTGSGSHRPPSLSPAAKARLARIVRRAPEVMVKVTGRSRGILGLKAHLDYVTRNGRLPAETQEGELIHDRAGVRRLHDDWLLTNAVTARGRSDTEAAQAVGVILSMPAGTPRDRVQTAARTWARETFGERYDWIMVRHDDKGHSHVHITVRAVGSDGKRLAPGPEDLQQWRERFAREMRRLGVQAEATPRQARGKVQRPDRTPIHRIEQRGKQPKVRQFQSDDAARAARSPRLPEPRDWQHDIQARQESIRRTYLAHAATLAEGDADDRRLARDIQRFVANMPVPLTRRQKMAAELRHVLEQHPGREHPAPSTASATAGRPRADARTGDRKVPTPPPRRRP
jgi:type IV secretion system T-DNA border endonuclease VirD2